jgi:tetratricopeptide (TPR) repeat protein
MTHRLRIASALVFAVLLPLAALAQNNRAWADPYEKGQDAVKAKRYQEAIAFLEAAIKANPKAEANKRIEGVYSTDYYPYYYLGVAYFESGSYRKAQENFEKAKSPAPRDKTLAAKLTEYVQKTQIALAAPAPASPTQPSGPPPAVARAPEPEPAMPHQEARREPAPAPASPSSSFLPSNAPEPPRAAAAAPSANIPGAADNRRPPDDKRTAEPSSSSPDALKSGLRSALRALFEGDAQACIAALEPLSRQKGSAADMATLHAYLGVAYATRALSARTLDESARDNTTAAEQFRLAVAAQSTFQLSSRMVSPKIVSMFNQARK